MKKINLFLICSLMISFLVFIGIAYDGQDFEKEDIPFQNDSFGFFQPLNFSENMSLFASQDYSIIEISNDYEEIDCPNSTKGNIKTMAYCFRLKEDLK